MSEPYIFATGMFRSGTTFLGRVLNAHPRFAVASDPYFEFFKAFRNEIYHRYFPGWNDAEPMSDYFLRDHTQALDEIQQATMDQPIRNQTLPEILKRIAEHGVKYSPLVMPHIQDIQASTYRELWTELVKRLTRVYAKSADSIMGCKEVWLEEMIAPFLRTFSGVKCIHIIRDPRAVIASNFSKDGSVIKYPLLFLIRQWRKSVAFHLLHRENKNCYFMVQYESLVNRPEETLRKMCPFIGVDFSADMLKTENFQDSRGNKWTQNSSYGTSSSINKEFNQKWKTALSSSQIQYIEDLCHWEMEFLGYERVSQPAFFESLFQDQTIREEEISAWMKPFHKEYQTSMANIAKEYFRLSLIRDEHKQSSRIERDQLKAVFIDPDYLSTVHPQGAKR